MVTTQLFVELLINGVGVIVWLVFLLALILGLPLNGILITDDALILPPVLAIAYVLGIIIDRAGRDLFKSLDYRNRDAVFGLSPEPSAYDRELYIWEKSQPLKEHAIYVRSRLRICRSWIINFALISVSYLAWNWKVKVIAFPKSLVLSMLCLVFSLGTFLIWRKLSKDYYKNIKSSYQFLKREESVTSPTGVAA